MKLIFQSRFYATIIIGLLPLTFATAQQVSVPSNNIPVNALPDTSGIPLVYPGLTDMTGITNYNFVRTEVPDIPVLAMPGYNNPRVRQVTNYFDGLGRPLQTVAKKAHADGRDIISHHVYDAVGNEVFQYLPFVKPVETSYGLFVPNPNTRMHQFYSGQDANQEPYSRTKYDNSPLNRVLQQMAPGKSWVGSERGLSYAYFGNAAAPAGQYPIFTIGSNAGALPVMSGSYSTGSLYVNKVTDEDGKISFDVKDRNGRLIMRRQQLTDLAPGTPFNPANYTTTLYIYDDLDRLRFVAPPAACNAAITGSGPFSWGFTQNIADGLCYQYFYDNRSRLVEKKIPGKAVEYYVYDQRDRLVYTQDGNLRAQNKWAFTFYDQLDRPISTGTAEFNVDRAQLMGYVAQPYTNFPSNSIFYYSNNYELYHVYPGSLPYCTMLSYTYYDDYGSYGPLPAYPYDSTRFSGANLPGDGTVTAPKRAGDVTGLMTGTRIKVMDPANPTADNWLVSAYYYDDKGRVIQTVSDNVKGGRDYSSNLYYFQGALWKNILHHQNPGAKAIPGANDGPFTNLRLEKTFNRNMDFGGGNDQVYHVTQKIGTGVAYNLAYYDYDHLGRAVVKQFPAANVLQEYNIRGFLNHIQVANYNNYDVNDNPNPHIFEEHLYYDQGFESKLYNGNIAGITWRKAGSEAPVESYGYSYDSLNRLNHAEYRRQDGGIWKKTVYDYTASQMTYDLNGNLQSMYQQGVPAGSSPVAMDQLAYTYFGNSNQLRKVKDLVAPSATQGLPDFKDSADVATEYSYDANGNMTTDANKHISAISYNYLNKPAVITTSQGAITYVYDAAGNRLRKTVHTNSSNTNEVYDYIGNFVYKDSVLQYILNEEGRTRTFADSNHLTKYVYDYFVKDHLGNVRSTVTAQPMNGIYLAEHELAAANIEQLIFDNIPNVRDGRPGSTDPEDHMAARLNAAAPERTVGTSILLKTMPGDRFSLSVDAYYEGTMNGESQATGDDVVSSLLTALTGGINYDGVPVSELPANVKTAQDILQNTSLGGLIDQLQNSDNPDAPKAHLNYLFFNDKFELLGGSSGSVQVPMGLQGWGTITPGGSNNNSSTVTGTEVSSDQGGYLLVYVDNQTIGKDVWFDHLMIGHYTGGVMEENHYYPFGLTVQTDGNPNAPKNDIKFQGQKHENEFGLNIYSFKYREHDPQIGRFWQVDPLADKYVHNSTYAFSENKVTGHIELEGLESQSAVTTLERDGSTTATEIPASTVGKTPAGRSFAVSPAAEQAARGTAHLVGQLFVDEMLADGEEAHAMQAANKLVDLAIYAIPKTIRFVNKTIDVVKVLANNAQEVNEIKSRSAGTKGGPRAGKNFTRKGKAEVWNNNRETKGGTSECENCGLEVQQPPKSEKGVPTPEDAGQVDHIYPKSKGGDGSPDNGQILCPGCNRAKSDNLPIPRTTGN